MQRGMNQTLAWLVAIAMAGIVFGIGGFWVMKKGGAHDSGDVHDMAAKTHEAASEHDKPRDNHGAPAEHAAKDEHHGTTDDHGEVLRPEH